MRCRVGDLAVIVRSRANNEGRIVLLVEFVGAYKYTERMGHNTWRYEPTLIGANGNPTNHADDDQLRPIRPDEGTDETLTWLDVPHKEVA